MEGRKALNPNFSAIVLKQVEELNAAINATQLIPSLPEKSTDTLSIEQIKDINLCIDDINHNFIALSQSTSNAIIESYQESAKTYKTLNKDNLREESAKIFAEQKNITANFQRLKKIKNLFNPNDVNALAEKARPNQPDLQEVYKIQLRFEHLNAAQLTQLSCIVETVAQYFAEKKYDVPALNQLVNNIIYVMKLRLEKSHSEVKDITNSQHLTGSSLLKTWVFQNHNPDALQPEKADKTFAATPELPFANNLKDFSSIEDYFLNFIFRHGNDNDKKWAIHQPGFHLKQAWVERALKATKDQLNPDKNAYVGLGVDMAMYTYDNMVKPIASAVNTIIIKPAIDIAETVIDVVSDNWVTQKFTQLSERANQNENFQKVKADLAGKVTALVTAAKVVPDTMNQAVAKMYAFNNATDNTVSKADNKISVDKFSALQKERDETIAKINATAEEINHKMKSLEEDWTWIDSDDNADKIEADIQAMVDEVSALQAKLKKHNDDIEHLNSKWVILERNEPEIVIESKKTTEETTQSHTGHSNKTEKQEEYKHTTANFDDLTEEDINEFAVKHVSDDIFEQNSFAAYAKKLKIENPAEENSIILKNARMKAMEDFINAEKNKYTKDEHFQHFKSLALRVARIKNELPKQYIFKYIYPDIITVIFGIVDSAKNEASKLSINIDKKYLIAQVSDSFLAEINHETNADTNKQFARASKSILENATQKIFTEKANEYVDEIYKNTAVTDGLENFKTRIKNEFVTAAKGACFKKFVKYVDDAAKQEEINNESFNLDLIGSLEETKKLFDTKFALLGLLRQEEQRIEHHKFNFFCSKTKTTEKLSALKSSAVDINKTLSLDALQTVVDKMLKDKKLTQTRRHLSFFGTSTTQDHLKEFARNNGLRKK